MRDYINIKNITLNAIDGKTDSIDTYRTFVSNIFYDVTLNFYFYSYTISIFIDRIYIANSVYMTAHQVTINALINSE